MSLSKASQVIGVLWDDAHYDTDEIDAANIVHRPWAYRTVGVLVRSDDQGITVASDVGEDGKFRGLNFIPRRMITEEWVIGGLDRKKRRPRTRTDPKPSV